MIIPWSEDSLEHMPEHYQFLDRRAPEAAGVEQSRKSEPFLSTLADFRNWPDEPEQEIW